MVILSAFFSFSCLFADFYYFDPPKDWSPALNLEKQSEFVKIIFFSKGKTEYPNNMNLAMEPLENSLSLKGYVKIAKDLHVDDRDTEWRDLGSFQTKSGKGQLTEITTKNEFGIVKQLQLIFLKNSMAYILTGAAIKEDFPKVRNLLIRSFRTLKVTKDWTKTLTKPALKTKVLKAYENLEALYQDKEKTDLRESSWKTFENLISTECKDMGFCWQFLFLQESYKNLTENEEKN